MRYFSFSFLIFFLVVLAIYFLINFFVFKQIQKGFNLSPRESRYLLIAFILLALTFFAGQIMLRSVQIEVIYLVGSNWLGILSIAFTIFLIQNLAALFLKSFKTSLFYIALILILTVSVVSFVRGWKMPELKKIELAYPQLHPDLNGLTILQISDLHLNGNNVLRRLKFLSKLIEEINPDLLLITGDLLDARICNLEKLCTELSFWKAKKGIFAVTGNHEYYVGKEEFLKLAQKLRWRVLQNELVIMPGGLEIIGVNDQQAKSFEKEQFNIPEFFKKLPAKRGLRILLNHRPYFFKEAVAGGIDLQLSGHTHAGQIPPMYLLVFLSYRYPYGLYKRENSFIYTTSGTGYWGPAMRLFSANEAVLFQIKKEEN